ncbi:MAG: 2OG-Fe(II) oxygenase [Lysobacterales bacterium]
MGRPAFLRSVIDVEQLFQHGLALNDSGQASLAIEAVAQAATSGHVQAQLQLAFWLLTGHNTEVNPQQGFALLQSLALSGHPMAQSYCASLTAGGVGTTQSWLRAIHWLTLAAEGGWGPAEDQLRLLGATQSLTQCEGDWKPASLPQTAVIDPSINLRHIRSAIDPKLCLHLANTARPYLKAARVNDAHLGDTTDTSRSNDAMGFYPMEADVISQLVRTQMATAGGAIADNAEVLSVLRYQQGQQYLPHYDFFDPQHPEHHPQLQTRGQRRSTVLLYLNGGYEGGHTRFVHKRLEFRGKPGDLLCFDNLKPDGTVNRLTLHEGCPVVAGKKWLASLWIRDRALN